MANVFNDYNRQVCLVFAEIEAAQHEVALKLGLTDSALLILYNVYLGGGSCLLSDITLWASKQTINSALRKLEAEGVVRLENFSGRKKQVVLTEKGSELTQSTVRRWIQKENAIADAWTQEERDLYLELTRRYLTGVKEKIREL